LLFVYWILSTYSGSEHLDENLDQPAFTRYNTLPTPTSPTSPHGYSVSENELDTPLSPTLPLHTSSGYQSPPAASTTSMSSNAMSSHAHSQAHSSHHQQRSERRKSSGSKVRAYELFAAERISLIVWVGCLKLMAE
jgi:hypothetical protein